MRKLIKVVLVTVTFLVFFYSTTIAMSIGFGVAGLLKLRAGLVLITIHAMR